MATKEVSSDQLSASTGAKSQLSRGQYLLEWNRPYAHMPNLDRVSGSDKGQHSKASTASTTAIGNSTLGICNNHSTLTTASRQCKRASHSSENPTRLAAASSDGFAASLAGGFCGDGFDRDGARSVSKSSYFEGFPTCKDVTSIGYDAQVSLDVEHNNNVICISNSNPFEDEGTDASQRLSFSSIVDSSRHFHSPILEYSYCEGFREPVDPNSPIHEAAYGVSVSESLNRFRSAPQGTAKLRYQSFAQSSFVKSHPPFHWARIDQHSTAHFGSARSPAARAATCEAGLATLLNSVPPEDWAHTTTIMLRNIPVKYNRQILLKELEQAGFLDGINLLYLPIVKKLAINRGYAFINFVAAKYAWAFKYVYDGRTWPGTKPPRVAVVIKSNKQGFNANYSCYTREWVKDPEARPWINPNLTPFKPPLSSGGVSPHDSPEEQMSIGTCMDPFRNQPENLCQKTLVLYF